MNHGRLIWVDVGMAMGMATFIGLTLFARNTDYFVPGLALFFVVFVIFAVVAEVAQTNAETNSQREASTAPDRAYRSPIPH